MVLQSLLAKKGILGSIVTVLYGGGGSGITGGALGFNDSKLALSSIKIDEHPEEVSSVNASLTKPATVQQQNTDTNEQSVALSTPKPDTVANQVPAQPTSNQNPKQEPSLQSQVINTVTDPQDTIQTKSVDTTVAQDTSIPVPAIPDNTLQTSNLPQADTSTTLDQSTDTIASTPSVSNDQVAQPPVPVTQPVSQPQDASQISSIPIAPTSDVAAPSKPAPLVQPTDPALKSSEPSTESTSEPVETKITMPGKIAKDPFYKNIKDAVDIESNITNVYCSNRMYADKLSGSDKPAVNDISQKPELYYSGNQAGCITVLGYKENYEANKGKGGFKFIGIMRNGTYSAMFVSTLEAKDGKFMVDGNVYILSSTEVSQTKASENGLNGKVVQGYKNSGRQEVTSERKDRLILQPGEMIQGAKTDGGFDFNDANVCKTGECTEDVLSYETSTESWTFAIGQTLNQKTYYMKDGSENKDKGAADDGLFPKHLTDPYNSLYGYFRKMTYTELPTRFQFKD